MAGAAQEAGAAGCVRTQPPTLVNIRNDDAYKHLANSILYLTTIKKTKLSRIILNSEKKK